MPIVSITRLRVRSWRYLPSFFIRALLGARQAAKADGKLKVTPGSTLATRGEHVQM